MLYVASVSSRETETWCMIEDILAMACRENHTLDILHAMAAISAREVCMRHDQDLVVLCDDMLTIWIFDGPISCNWFDHIKQAIQ